MPSDDYKKIFELLKNNTYSYPLRVNPELWELFDKVATKKKKTRPELLRMMIIDELKKAKLL